MEVSTLVNKMLVLLVMIALGYFCNKIKIMDEVGTKKINTLLMKVLQCAMILSSVLSSEEQMTIGRMASFVGSAFIAFAVVMILGFIVSRMMHVDPRDRVVYRFATVFSNSGFIGYPVLAAIYGPGAVFYGALFNIASKILLYSLGIAWMKGGGGEKFKIKTLINSPMICTFIAILIMLLKIPIPAFISEAATSVGNTNTPIAMLVIGASLGSTPLKEAFGDWRVYVYSPLKLFLCPIIVHIVLSLIIKDQLLIDVCTLLTAMPSGAVTTTFALQYGQNSRLASRVVFVTTVLSMATIPLVVYFLM